MPSHGSTPAQNLVRGRALIFWDPKAPPGTKKLDAMDAAARGVDPAVIKAQSEAEIPIQRYGTPAEFGAVAAFLATDEAAYVTGIALPIDGGSSRGMI